MQYVVGLAALALAAATVGYAEGPQGRGDAQGGRGAAAPAAPAAPARPLPAILQNYAAVTEARLKNPEENNWLLLRRTYNGWGYSPLKQITTANVTRLRPVWSYATGEVRYRIPFDIFLIAIVCAAISGDLRRVDGPASRASTT